MARRRVGDTPVTLAVSSDAIGAAAPESVMLGASPDAIGAAAPESVMWFSSPGAIRMLITELVMLSAGLGLMPEVSLGPFLMPLGVIFDRVESVLMSALMRVLVILSAILPHL